MLQKTLTRKCVSFSYLTESNHSTITVARMEQKHIRIYEHLAHANVTSIGYSVHAQNLIDNWCASELQRWKQNSLDIEPIHKSRNNKSLVFHFSKTLKWNWNNYICSNEVLPTRFLTRDLQRECLHELAFCANINANMG